MGKLMLPAVALALVAGDGAAIAQTVAPIVQPQHAPRWGEPVNGRWSGGARAPRDTATRSAPAHRAGGMPIAGPDAGGRCRLIGWRRASMSATGPAMG